HLTALKVKLLETKVLEKNILINANSLNKPELRRLYEDVSKSFLDISALLSQLTNIQTTVGKQLQKESQHIISGTRLYSTIQLILAIIIGVLIVSILFASRVVNLKNDKYTLN